MAGQEISSRPCLAIFEPAKAPHPIPGRALARRTDIQCRALARRTDSTSAWGGQLQPVPEPRMNVHERECQVRRQAGGEALQTQKNRLFSNTSTLPCQISAAEAWTPGIPARRC